MSGGLQRCAACGHDWGRLEYRQCCGLIWATCGRCSYAWSQTTLEQQAPAQEPLSPEQLKDLLQAHRDAHPGSFEAVSAEQSAESKAAWRERDARCNAEREQIDAERDAAWKRNEGRMLWGPSLAVRLAASKQKIDAEHDELIKQCVVRIPEESLPAIEQVSSEATVIPPTEDGAAALAGRDVVEPTAADIERARNAWETGRQELVREPWMAMAQELANERERAAKECEALEDEFATAACKLEHSHSERVDVLRAQADGCAQCAFVIRSGDNE